MITSNLIFSEWERIFNEPMATAAAIDRLAIFFPRGSFLFSFPIFRC